MSEKLTYRVPISGNYMCTASMVTYKRTGRRVMQENYSRKWWQIWKPKEIEVDELVPDETHDGRETRFLNKGEEVGLNAIINRMGY